MRSLAWQLGAVLFAASASAAELCFEPDSLYGNVTMDCCSPVPSLWPNAWTGYSTLGPPCHSDGWTAFDSCSNSESPYPYGWTLSGSAADPDQNVGSSGDEPLLLYLWLRCISWCGGAAAAFAIEGDIPIAGFTPASGWINVGSATHLVLAYSSCVDHAPALVGTFSVRTTAVASPSWGRVKARYRSGR
ncbi:MAG: hypothetical protein U0167_13000 [bacterium]